MTHANDHHNENKHFPPYSPGANGPLGAGGGAAANHPPRLAAWQIDTIDLVLNALVQKAHEGGHPLPVPPLAEMVTTYGPPTDPRGQVAYDGAIRVCVTLPDDTQTQVGFWELWTLLWSQPQRIRAVEPLTDCLTFILHVHDRLLAWDLRSLVSASAGDLTIQREFLTALGLFTCGPADARIRRREQFYHRLSTEERALLLRDVVTDEMLAPGRKRVPLRGLIHAGIQSFDTGETRQPFRLFRYFDAALRRRLRAPRPERGLISAVRGDADAEHLQDLIATLPPQEAQAMQLYLESQHRGFATFKAFCQHYGHNYNTRHQALQRAIEHLRPPS
jgi:hypothetical protein